MTVNSIMFMQAALIKKLANKEAQRATAVLVLIGWIIVAFGWGFNLYTLSEQQVLDAMQPINVARIWGVFNFLLGSALGFASYFETP